MKYVLSVLFLVFSMQVLADDSGKGGSDIGSSSLLDTSFRAGDEVKEMEMKTLQLPKSQNGVLVNLYACVSSKIAAAAMQMQLETQFKASTMEAFRSVPFGKKLMDKILEDDPNALNLNLENLPYTESCKNEIIAVQSERRVSSEMLAKVLRLSELSGQALGQYMTSSK